MGKMLNLKNYCHHFFANLKKNAVKGKVFKLQQWSQSYVIIINLSGRPIKNYTVCCTTYLYQYVVGSDPLLSEYGRCTHTFFVSRQHAV